MNTFRCLLFVICILFYCCQSPSKDNPETFKKVDVSLYKSNEEASDSLKDLYALVNNTLGKNDSLKLQADSICFYTKNAITFIDSLKNVLNQKDPTGDRTDVATKLLVNTEVSKRLQQKLIAAQSAGSEGTGEKGLGAMSGTLQTFSILEDPEWDELCLNNAPTTAAVTMLTKFQNDCYGVAIAAMKSISLNTNPKSK